MITCIKDDLRRVYTVRMGRDLCVVPYSLTQSNAEVNSILYRLVNRMAWNSDAGYRWCEGGVGPNAALFFALVLEVEGVDRVGAKQIMEGSVLA